MQSLIHRKSFKPLFSTLYAVLPLTLSFNCTNYDKRNRLCPVETTALCNNTCYLETYNVFSEGGAIGGTVATEYLTDSTNFRKYIGSFDEADGGYSYKCKGDSIIVYEISGRSTQSNRIESVRMYDLQALKKSKVQE